MRHCPKNTVLFVLSYSQANRPPLAPQAQAQALTRNNFSRELTRRPQSKGHARWLTLSSGSKAAIK